MTAPRPSIRRRSIPPRLTLPRLIQPRSIQPRLIQPVDPTPVDPTPVDPTPVDPTPVDPTPVDPTRLTHPGRPDAGLIHSGRSHSGRSDPCTRAPCTVTPNFDPEPPIGHRPHHRVRSHPGQPWSDGPARRHSGAGQCPGQRLVGPTLTVSTPMGTISAPKRSLHGRDPAHGARGMTLSPASAIPRRLRQQWR